jgi:acyl-CoA dehydrogenase
VPQRYRIGAEGQGFIYQMQQVQEERLWAAASCLQSLTNCIQWTVEWAQDRKLFGSTLADQQWVQFKLAELKTEATVGRVFYNDCVARHLNGGLDPVTASMAKYWLSDLQGKIVDECLQLFGGYGYMNEYPIARMYAAARVQKIYGGTNEIMKELVARSL